MHHGLAGRTTISHQLKVERRLFRLFWPGHFLPRGLATTAAAGLGCFAATTATSFGRGAALPPPVSVLRPPPFPPLRGRWWTTAFLSRAASASTGLLCGG